MHDSGTRMRAPVAEPCSAGVRLVCGLRPEAAFQLVFSWWERQRRLQGEPFLVVPAHSDVLEWTTRLASREGALFGGPCVGTFDDLVRALCGGETAGVSLFGRLLLTFAAGEDLWGRADSIIGRIPQVVPAVAQVLGELDELGLPPEQIVQGIDRWASRAGSAPARAIARELRDLYLAYSELGRNLGLSSEAQRVSLRGGRPGEGRAAAGECICRPTLCLGFTTFTPVQRQLLEGIAQRAPVVIELPWDGTPSTRFLDEEVRLWERAGAEVQCPAAVADGVNGVPVSTEVRLLQSSGRRGELETVGAETVELLRQGLAPSEVLIVARRPAVWVRLVREVLGSYQIPVAIEAPLPLSATGLGRAVTQALAEREAETCLSPEGIVQIAEESAPRFLSGVAADVYVAAQEVRALQAVRKAARELDLVHSVRPSLLQKPRQIVDFLRRCPVGLPVGLADEVLVAGAARVRLRRPRVTFMLGLVDGEFPERGDQMPFLPAPLRRDCNQSAGFPLLREEPEGLDDLAFQLAFRSATEVVYLSQRLVDDEGGALFPSPYLDTARSSREGGLRPWARRTLADVLFPPEHAPSRREYLRSCAAGAQGTFTPSTRPAGARAARPARRGVELREPRALHYVADQVGHTAGEIEQFADCPLRWFFQSVVGVTTPLEDGDPRYLGLVTHEVLAQLYSLLRERRLLPLTAELLPAANAAMEEVMEAAVASTVSLPSRSDGARADDPAGVLLRARVRNLVRAVLEFEVNRAAGVASVTTEQGLPRDGVDLGDGLVVRGRIDRVDELGGGLGLLVIDYKTGWLRFSQNWAEDGALQVPLYMLALAAVYPHRRVIGGGYLALKEREFHGVVREGGSEDLAGAIGGRCRFLGEGEYLAFLESCRLKAAAHVRSMQAGRYERPDRGRCPRYCSFRLLCRQGTGYGRTSWR